MRELALFAGAGGGLLAEILGWRTVCAVEIDPYARSVLLARQDDGCLEPFPVWDDVATFDGRPWSGCVDIISGGFPCQDISSAGKKRGIGGNQSGLWGAFARIIREVRPRYVYAENSSDLIIRGLDTVLRDLAALGFHAEWGVIGARHAGAPHKRDRCWVVGCHPDRESEPAIAVDAEVAGLPRNTRAREISDSHGSWRKTVGAAGRTRGDGEPVSGDNPWAGTVEPPVVRMDDGMAHRMDRLRCVGNGQVPAVAAMAWRVLTARLEAAAAPE